jgi:hypothetical protein
MTGAEKLWFVLALIGWCTAAALLGSMHGERAARNYLSLMEEERRKT